MRSRPPSPSASTTQRRGSSIATRWATASSTGGGRKNLVFLDYPSTGLYDIYADPFASCGQPAVRFTLTVYEPGADGNLHPTFTRSGEILASQTTGGALPAGGSVAGLFVAEKEFE